MLPQDLWLVYSYLCILKKRSNAWIFNHNSKSLLNYVWFVMFKVDIFVQAHAQFPFRSVLKVIINFPLNIKVIFNRIFVVELNISS